MLLLPGPPLMYIVMSRARIRPSFDEPKECIDGIVLLYRSECEWWQRNIASVLLLGRESCCTCAHRRRLETYSDVAIGW